MGINRIAVIGPGATGGLLGGYLRLAGRDVVLVDNRPERADKIQREGLVIQGVRGEKVVRVPCAAGSAGMGPVDLVLLTVKAYDTGRALDEHRRLVGPGTAVLTVQNGLGNVEAILERVAPERVVAGTTALGVNEVEPGRIHHAGEGETAIGPAAPAGADLAGEVASILTAAGIQTRVIDDVQAQIWSKLVVNVGINALTAILRVRNGVLVQHADTEAVQAAAVREALDVAAAEGVRLDAAALPERVKEVARRTGANRSSMLMDVLLGRRTEIDFINGAIVERGRRQGIATPVNETLTRLVHAIERTGADRV